MSNLYDQRRLAWQRCQEAWEKAGMVTPCYDPEYLAAREALAAVQAQIASTKRSEKRAHLRAVR